MDIDLPDSADESTADNIAVVWSTSLEATAKAEDQTTAQDCAASTEIVADRSSDCSSDKGTGRQKGRDEANLSSRGSELVQEGLTSDDWHGKHMLVRTIKDRLSVGRKCSYLQRQS